MTQKSEIRDSQERGVEELTISAKLVFKTLQYEGDLTQKELVEKTTLVGRTVRSALNKLEEIDEITSRVKYGDARQKVYSINDTSRKR
ncbi:MarR family transcriptional regulator [Haloarcula sp. JP-L23]|uniref:MarR family transcriptional regulator n=1 Tax=Haloarcula sp. JP-L23 TaxID=2716717 RepID=UPI00187848F4